MIYFVASNKISAARVDIPLDISAPAGVDRADTIVSILVDIPASDVDVPAGAGDIADGDHPALIWRFLFRSTALGLRLGRFPAAHLHNMQDELGGNGLSLIVFASIGPITDAFDQDPIHLFVDSARFWLLFYGGPGGASPQMMQRKISGNG
jgi:hypothetical protein